MKLAISTLRDIRDSVSLVANNLQSFFCCHYLVFRLPNVALAHLLNHPGSQPLFKWSYFLYFSLPFSCSLVTSSKVLEKRTVRNRTSSSFTQGLCIKLKASSGYWVLFGRYKIPTILRIPVSPRSNCPQTVLCS